MGDILQNVNRSTLDVVVGGNTLRGHVADNKFVLVNAGLAMRENILKGQGAMDKGMLRLGAPASLLGTPEFLQKLRPFQTD
jgi:hypothetical protein